MAHLLRGDIVWADSNPVRGREQSGSRPVLVLSHELFNRKSGTVIAMSITSSAPRAGYPLTMELPQGSLPQESWIKISQIRTISVARLGKRAGRIPDDKLGHVVEGLLELIE